MFFKNNKEESAEVKRLYKIIEKKSEEYEEVCLAHRKTIDNLHKDYEITLARKDAEVDVIVLDKTKALTDEVAKLKLENGNYKKEVEILTKAFQNLGFDVKDMKDILNKLVDGIVSKNTVNIVK